MLDEPGPSLAECEKLAQKVALPPIKAGMSKRVLIARYRAALIAADKNLENTAACIAEIRSAAGELEARSGAR